MDGERRDFVFVQSEGEVQLCWATWEVAGNSRGGDEGAVALGGMQ